MSSHLRTHGLVIAGVLALTSIAPDAQDQSPAAQPNFRLGVHLVRVQVAVTDKSGSVPDLGDNDFEIIEDGKFQSIEHVELLKWRKPRGGRQRQPASRRATEEQPRPETGATIDVPLPGVSGAYYTVVYSRSDAPIDGRFHVLEVRVKRPGTSVRAPAGYRADGPTTP